MRSGDENEERRASAASSSPSPMQADPPGDEEREESSHSLNEIAPEDSTQRHGGSRVPLEDVLKGLITSQIKGPHVHVEEGLLNLLKDCLIAEHPFFTSASLSGCVDHFQSVDDEDLGWGCGWRNIQILCSFLLAEDEESRDALFNGAGFVPDIPALQTWLEIAWAKGFDEPGAEYFNWAIAGTRKWIGTTECAALLRSFGVRAKIVSFTALGGKRIRCDLQQTFGGSPIILSDDDEDRASSDILNDGVKKCPVPNDTATSRGGAIIICNECGKICLHGTNYRGIVKKDSDLCDDCMTAASLKGVSLEGGGLPASRGKNKVVEVDTDIRLDPETSAAEGNKLPASNDHHWNFKCDGCGNPLRGRRYKSLMKRDFDLCSNCMKEVEDDSTGERGSHKDYVIIEEYPAMRNSGPPLQDQQEDDGSDVVYEVEGGIDHEDRCDDMKQDTSLGEVEDAEVPLNEDFSETQTFRERGGKSVDGKEAGSEYHQKDTAPSKQNLCENAAGYKPLAKGERKKAGMHSSASSVAENSDINHHHLIEWVWSYFTEDSARRFAATSQNIRDLVTMSKRSPLYFQHRGHSRTIVGIERRRKPTGISEDVHLLVLDPSVSTELLVKSLRDRSGWQQLIKYDVDSLKEAEYQLCYADPGIAVGEELEQLKLLSSLRYSYYSK